MDSTSRPGVQQMGQLSSFYNTVEVALGYKLETRPHQRQQRQNRLKIVNKSVLDHPKQRGQSFKQGRLHRSRQPIHNTLYYYTSNLEQRCE